MALIKCPECASEISDKAASCPKCGYPIASGSPVQSVPTMPADGVTHEEQFVFAMHPSRKPVWIAVGLVILFFLIFWLPSRNQPVLGGLTSLLLFVLIVVVAAMELQRAKTEYGLTTERVMIRTGIIGRFERTIPLSKIQNVTSGYSILQRLLGIGNIIIESAGELTGRVYMLGVDSPLQYANRIVETVRSNQRQQAARP